MHSGKAVFSQLMDWIHPEQFRRCVTRYDGNYKVRHFSCWDQFLAMAFAQITFRESLADIEICLRSRQEELYHLGFRSSVAQPSLGRCQQRTGLAYLCRSGAGTDPTRPQFVCARALGLGTRPHRLCVGFHHHRPVLRACFRGRVFAQRRPPSNSTPCSTCADPSRP